MKILSIGTIDNKGGAANISWEIRKCLKRNGHIVDTFVRYKYSNKSDVHQIKRGKWRDWLVKIFANDLWFGAGIMNTKEYRQADLIHCHNLHSNFFRLKDLIKMSREKPVIWTLHDMWAFTGFAYNSYTLKHPNKKRFLFCLWDNTPFMLWQKKKIYQKSKIAFVTVSNWLQSEAEKSILKNQKILRIYNGVDEKIFEPRNKLDMRKKFGLPLGRKLVGFDIKGWLDSEKVVRSLTKVTFVSIGHSKIKTPNCINLPHTSDRSIMAEYLSCLDVFLHPTPEEAFGLVTAEAMICGVPVVTYDIDAMPEIVGDTGYIFPYGDIEGLKKGVLKLLEESEEKGTAARKRVLEKFTVERMYREYFDLYKKIIFLHEQQKKD